MAIAAQPPNALDRTTVKNIIFDLGGVILNIDYTLTLNAFSELRIKNPEAQFNQLKQTPLFDDYETGRIGSEEFRQGLRKYIPSQISDQELDKAWNAMLLDLPKERIILLERLGKEFRIFLLSNTNEIHILEFHRRLVEWFDMPDLSHIFEQVHYSYEMGMRKPDPEIFEAVIEQNGLAASETLFIDDSPQHIEGAKSVGLQAHFLSSDQNIVDFFTQGFS